MGVPQLFAWLSRKYPRIVKHAKEEKPTKVNGMEIPVNATKPNPNGVEFDNLYLDMNGIIHPCCHPEDKAEPETEEDMMMAIFEYIDRIFAICRPRRLVHFAVDGPAPRAKMNQQRARRFRAAMESAQHKEDLQRRRDELIARGKKLPAPKIKKKNPFDSNCITPGTEFMSRLSQYLEYYILDRLSSNPAWANVMVIFSDSSVAGEGEHKIMEFIRRQRMCKDHNPNLKHLLYGADADLIMLGLASHEPHFWILREEWRPPTRKPCEICNVRGHKFRNCPGLLQNSEEKQGWGGKTYDVKFLFVELSILREYLDRELRANTTVPSTNRHHVERMIDDWIFLCFFVGNDFLPHLPSLRVKEGAIDRLVGIYKSLPSDAGKDNYLHKDGVLDMRRLRVLMDELGKVEDKIFVARHEKRAKKFTKREQEKMDAQFGKKTAQQQYVHGMGKEQDEASMWMTTLATADNMDDKAGKKSDIIEIRADGTVDTSMLESIEDGITYTKDNVLSDAAQKWLAKKREVQELRKKRQAEDMSDNEEESTLHPLGAVEAEITPLDQVQEGTPDVDEEQDEIRLWEAGAKERYYLHKYQIDATNHKFKTDLACEYISGLQWVLLYYYQGVRSWTWFFPYHYAPFASDLSYFWEMGLDKDFQPFTNDTKPFSPILQLMAVYPPASANLIPEVARPLLTDSKSILADLYPLEFDTDRNGFRHDWQGVALLPFIEQKRLSSAFKEHVLPFLSTKEKKRNRFGHDKLYGKLSKRQSDGKKQGPETGRLLLRCVGLTPKSAAALDKGKHVLPENQDWVALANNTLSLLNGSPWFYTDYFDFSLLF